MAHKSFLFLARKAPHGSGRCAEMLDAALIAASFDQQVHLAFLDDGVFQLIRQQQPGAIERTDLAATLLDLGDCDIDQVWVERQSLAERGLSESDLVIPATVIDRADLARLMAGVDIVVSA